MKLPDTPENRVALPGGGFVRLVMVAGDDDFIAECARRSVPSAEKHSTTRNLLRYMLRNRHTSPFEMGKLWFHVRVDKATFDQAVRHRMANWQVMSMRYEDMGHAEFYTPDEWRAQSARNKQGSDGKPTIGDHLLRDAVNQLFTKAIDTYRFLRAGNVAKELARLVLPFATYTEFYVCMDVHNFMHFLSLRDESHAQQEIQEMARAMRSLWSHHYPITAEAFTDYREHAWTLSRIERDIVTQILREYPEGIAAIAERMQHQVVLGNSSTREAIAFLDVLEGRAA